jgi:hypothetical protein
MSSGGNQTPPTSTSTYQMSAPEQEMLHLALPGIEKFAANAPQRYQGQTVVGFDPNQTAGQQMALGAAGGQDQLAQAGADNSKWWLDPARLDVNNDPYVRSAIDASTRPITQQLLEQALPNLRSGSIASGGFGGSRQGIAEGLATGRAAQAVGDTASKVAEDAVNARMAQQGRVLGLLPQTQQALLSGATTTSGVGDIRQQLAQRLRDADVAGFNFDQYAPFMQSQALMQIMQGLRGTGTTVNTGSTPNQPSTTQKALGGALAGASAGAAIGGPWGAGIGAIGGGALPFLFG